MVKPAAAKTSFGTLQNPDHVSNVVVIHSSFSPDGGSNYCIVTPGADHHRLRIFDTTTGTIKNDYEQKEGDGKWTCVRWGSINESSANGVCLSFYPSLVVLDHLADLMAAISTVD